MMSFLKSRRIWAIFVVALALSLTALWQISRARCFQLTGEIICRVETDQKIIALTFDDGPTPRGLESVRPVLAQENVKATFFLTGKDVERNPDLARQLVLDGHELGNHSYSHKRMMGRSSAFYREEIVKTDALLRAAGEKQPRLFRPPYGKKLWGLPRALERQNYVSVMIDVEEPIGSDVTAQIYADRVVKAARPGSILLMHVMYKPNQVARNALPLVIQGLKRRGFDIVPVGELLKHQN